MTIVNNVPKSLLVAITDDLPRPDACSMENSSSIGGHTALPRPTGSTPNVTDAGRIRFGAGYRLPSSK